MQFYADLCAQLGEPDQALDALRRAVRANESDVPTLTRLAEALAREFRTEEAIEIYWKAFERSADLDTRLGQVAKLTELHLRRNQFDPLVAWLERLQPEDGRRREGTFFVAQAYASLGDDGNARHQLEALLEANARDTALLKQLSRLAEDEADIQAALKFQQQLHEVAPDRDSAKRLADLALKAGEIDVAESLWAKTTETGQDLASVMLALGSLASNGRFEAVLATTNRLLRSDPGNWEALYREARTLESFGRKDEAAGRFRALLDLRRDDDEPSAAVKSLRKMASRMPSQMIVYDGAGVEYRSSARTTARYVAGLTSGIAASRFNGWSPRDFGQARIAALAHELARVRRDGTEAEWLAGRRQSSERKPVDPRRAWDDYYVSLLFDDQKQVYEAARDLVRAGGHDPSADYLLLSSLSTRTIPAGAPPATRILDDTGPDLTPPLPADEVDLVRDALRSLLSGKSSLISSPIARAAMTELRRAGRIGEVEADYRALVDSANDHHRISIAGYLAAERGDLDALRKVYQAFYRLPIGNRQAVVSAAQSYGVSTPQGNFVLPTLYMSQGMKVMADAKRYGDILRLVDEELVAIKAPARVAERAKSASASSRSSPVANRYPVFTTGRVALQVVEYPTPNRYLDVGSILLLRGAFTFFKRDDRAGELVTHLRKVAADSANEPTAERDARLALSAVLWWNDERDPAARELARAVELAPGDVELKLLTADMRAMRREPEEALAVVDSIEAVDQDVTRRRELLALRLAVQTGRAERARQAAERLFGLRLDPPTQLQLAAQMHQLGMHDLADAVLARARRQVGNNAEALAELMAQYRRQGNLDTASQIAIDVLRRSNSQALRIGIVEDPHQRQAMDVLVASGKLKEMIERVEGQVKTSPKSLSLQQALAAYYRAAGQLDKLKATNEAILKLRPEDTALRMQVATQLAQAGDLASALDHYRAVFQHDPSMLSTYSTAIFATFQQANRLDELVKLIEQVGLKTFDDPTSTRTLVVTLLKDPKSAERGSALLVKALEAYSTTRLAFLGPIVALESFWTRPEAYEIAKRAVIPADGAPLVDPWAGPGDGVQLGGFGQDGKTNTLTTRLLEAATRSGKLDDLAGSIEAALARQKGWQGGRVLLALVRLRQGRVEEGRSALEAILADPASPPPFVALGLLGQEVKDLAACQPLAIAVYERGSKNPVAVNSLNLYIRASVAWNLAMLYRKAGRLGEALTIARQAEEQSRSSIASGSGGSVILASYRLVNGLVGLGSLYLELGDHADAVRLYDEFFGSPDEVQVARTYDTRDLYPSVDSLIARSREGFGRALDGLTVETLPLTLESLIKPGDATRPVDLRLVVFPREVDQATIRSLFASALDLAARDPAALAKLKADLDAILKARPGGFEARVAVALAASVGGDPAAIAPAALALDRLADETPLPPLSAGTRPDARTRDEATRRLGLWLVARRCWEHDSTAELGDRLAAKALDAARRLPDPHWGMAMLRELGRKAFDRGDRPGAEARFASLLGLIQQDALAQPPSAPAPSPAPTRPVPAGRPVPANARARVPAFTVGRFRQSAEFAALASEAGLADLSLKAVRDALKGGPPVVPVTLTTTPQPVLRTTAANAGAPVETPPDPTIVLVEAKLVALDALWTRAKVAPEAVYEALRDVVFPPARPADVFLYDPELTRTARPSSADTTPRPGELAKLLARKAKAAGRLDDLRRKVDERKDSPPARDAARRLLVAIDEASKLP